MIDFFMDAETSMRKTESFSVVSGTGVKMGNLASRCSHDFGIRVRYQYMQGSDVELPVFKDSNGVIVRMHDSYVTSSNNNTRSYDKDEIVIIVTYPKFAYQQERMKEILEPHNRFFECERVNVNSYNEDSYHHIAYFINKFKLAELRKITLGNSGITIYRNETIAREEIELFTAETAILQNSSGRLLKVLHGTMDSNVEYFTVSGNKAFKITKELDISSHGSRLVIFDMEGKTTETFPIDHKNLTNESGFKLFVTMEDAEREATKDSNPTLLRQFELETEELKLRREEELGFLEVQFKQNLDKQKAELSELEEKHRLVLLKMRNDHADEIDLIRREHKRDLEKLKNANADEIENTKNKHVYDLAELRKRNEEEMVAAGIKLSELNSSIVERSSQLKRIEDLIKKEEEKGRTESRERKTEETSTLWLKLGVLGVTAGLAVWKIFF